MKQSALRLSLEEFSFLEMGVRLRQCELFLQFTLKIRSESRRRLQHELAMRPIRALWGASYKLPFEHQSMRATVAERISTFETRFEMEAFPRKKKILVANRPTQPSFPRRTTKSGPKLYRVKVELFSAKDVLGGLANFLRDYARFTATKRSTLNWFEFGMLVAAGQKRRAVTKWPEESALAEMERLLGITRGFFVETTKNELVRRPLSQDWIPEAYGYWNVIETRLDSLRNSMGTEAPVPEVVGDRQTDQTPSQQSARLIELGADAAVNDRNTTGPTFVPIPSIVLNRKHKRIIQEIRKAEAERATGRIVSTSTKAILGRLGVFNANPTATYPSVP